MVLDLGDDCLLLRAQLNDAGGFQRDLIVMASVVEGLQTQSTQSAPGQVVKLALQARHKPHAIPLHVYAHGVVNNKPLQQQQGKVKQHDDWAGACTGWHAATAGKSANRVGALVLQIGLGQHDDSALLHDGLKFVHALVEGATADFAALRVQQLKGEQFACTGNRNAVPAYPAQLGHLPCHICYVL